jgi:hypothetical protein
MVLAMLHIHAMQTRHVRMLGLVNVGSAGGEMIVPAITMEALETSLPLALQARLVILQVLHLRTELGQLSNMAVESSHQI